MNKRTKRALQVGGGVALLSLLIVGIASASDDDKDESPCSPDEMPNPMYAAARAAVINSGLKGSALALALSKIPLCVPKDCSSLGEGWERDTATGACVRVQPGKDPTFDPWKPGTDDEDKRKACIDSGGVWDPATKSCHAPCGADEFWSPIVGRCLPKPPDPVEPGKIDDIVRPVPVPGNFYQVRKGDIFFGTKTSNGIDGKGLSICYMALRRAAYEAARVHGQLEEAEAWAHVNQHASILKHEIKSLRPYLNIISCGWWTDELYSSWRYSAGKSTPGPTGRAVTINNPAHAPNLARMRAGLPPARNVRLGKPGDGGKGAPTIADGSWRSYPLFWIPEIDLEIFWNSAYNEITADGLTWDDGSSRAVPPPWVQGLGIFDATGTLQAGTVMGCGPSQKAVT